MPTWPASISPPMPVKSPEITKASQVSRLAVDAEPIARQRA